MSLIFSRPRPCSMIPARSSAAKARLADSREEPASCASSAWVARTTTSCWSQIAVEADSARALAAQTLAANPGWFSELSTAPVIEVLANAPAPDNPYDAAGWTLPFQMGVNVMVYGINKGSTNGISSPAEIFPSAPDEALRGSVAHQSVAGLHVGRTVPDVFLVLADGFL